MKQVLLRLECQKASPLKNLHVEKGNYAMRLGRSEKSKMLTSVFENEEHDFTATNKSLEQNNSTLKRGQQSKVIV